MNYDYLILGGGIAGLYSAYQILKKTPHARLILLEKDDTLGGRVYTFTDKHMSVEAGAARFTQNHTHLWELIHDLRLASKIRKISGEATFMKSVEGIYSMDLPIYHHSELTPHKIRELIAYHSNTDYSLIAILTKIVSASYLDFFIDLHQISFLNYAKKVVSAAEVQHIVDSFGYYSELVIMNAHDAIELMKHLSPDNQYYTLSGGLGQIISELARRILAFPHTKIIVGSTVKSIHMIDGVSGGFMVEVSMSHNRYLQYYGNTCICALPKQVVEKFAIFSPVKSLFNHLLCAPLCRIYSKFESTDGKVWFKGLPKLTTNNNLRMVIPISEKDGTIMMSYTDNKFADFWMKLYDKHGLRGVNRELMRLIEMTTGIIIPYPKDTHVFYWKCGVGYWGVGADSKAISEKIACPYPGQKLYICGEHYSEKNQQWMEGALEYRV